MMIWFESVHDSFKWIWGWSLFGFMIQISKSHRVMIVTERISPFNKVNLFWLRISCRFDVQMVALPAEKQKTRGSSILLRVSLHPICVCQASPSLTFWAARTATLRLTMFTGRVEMRRTAECMDGDGGFFFVPMWLGHAWMRFFFCGRGPRLFGREDISETQHSYGST